MKKILKGFKITLNMGKTVFILFFLLLHVYFCTAQDDNDKEGDDIKAVRTAYITTQLKLTPDEAQRFWPIYNTYLRELRQARRDNPNDVVAQQEQIVNIQKKYKGDFKGVIGSDDRVNKTFTAERDFRNVLRNERNRREIQNNNNRQPMQQMRQQKLKKN